MAEHADLQSIHKAAYVGNTDPALDAANKVAAGKLWLDTSSLPPSIKLRDALNTDWTPVTITDSQVRGVVQGMLQAGANVTLDYDAAAGTLTINASGGAPALTLEDVDDRVASLIVAGTNITKTYDDAAGTLILSAAGGSAAAASLLTAVVTDNLNSLSGITQLPASNSWQLDTTSADIFNGDDSMAYSTTLAATSLTWYRPEGVLGVDADVYHSTAFAPRSVLWYASLDGSVFIPLHTSVRDVLPVGGSAYTVRRQYHAECYGASYVRVELGAYGGQTFHTLLSNVRFMLG
ncbi:MAG: hypothetical protein MSG64_16640 [Pyrinomonadaceae bacterium MAG19_C2-C3]|nr:hypothetical protein [Pyrinomonadaceae bacterium MAG19_C2-C3]